MDSIAELYALIFENALNNAIIFEPHPITGCLYDYRDDSLAI